MPNNYWKECVECALEDAMINATEKQIEIITEVVEGSFENYSMHMGYDCIPNPSDQTIKDLKKRLDDKDEISRREMAMQEREADMRAERLKNRIYDLQEKLREAEDA